MDSEARRFFEGVFIIFFITVILLLTHMLAFSYGKYKAKAELKCGQAECMQYRIEGELSCKRHEGDK